MEPKTFLLIDSDSSLASRAPWAITATHFLHEGDLVVFMQDQVRVASMRLGYGQTVVEQNAIVNTGS